MTSQVMQGIFWDLMEQGMQEQMELRTDALLALIDMRLQLQEVEIKQRVSELLLASTKDDVIHPYIAKLNKMAQK